MYLGIDIGTSAVKAVIIGDDGAIAAQASFPLPIARPRPNWSEQDPADWWQATCKAVTALPASYRLAIQGLGLSGQMHGATLLNANEQPLRPAILWNDGRAIAECAELEAAVPDSRTITGNIAMPGFTAPKLLWIRLHEPEIFDAIARVLLPKDYARLILTGEAVSDMSDSAGTLWLDTAARDWSDEMLAATRLDRRHMPRLIEGSAVSGIVRPDVAAQLGIPAVPVAGGGGDNAAGAIGVGVTRPGDGFLSLGTSGVIFTVSDGFAPNPARAVHSFCHALPNRWHQMAVILSAASCLDWVARLVGATDVAAALALAEGASEDHVPIFLPYLSGERTPHNDPSARGAFIGLDHDTDRGLLVRSVLEGVAFALADGADTLRSGGTPIDALTVIGGGARSALWGRILATTLGCRLDYRADADIGPALGAAKLARLAITGDPIDEVLITPRLVASVFPDPALAAYLAPRRARFRSLYPALKDLSL
ncbi:MAG: xylulokinase [Sphingorhabdus sp.]